MPRQFQCDVRTAFRYDGKLTIRVVVITLAAPKPCGMTSPQRLMLDEVSFQKMTRILAIIVKSEEANVRK